MARYTGPRTKIARKFGEAIYGPDKYFERKNYPPGFHGATKKRRKTSEYGLQLKEKVKAKYTYGVLERQFLNTFKKAQASKGVTGEVLLQLLESRLDNLVYRLGISPSRAGARQLVSHRHITLNGSIVSIPSYQVKPGDTIGVREKSKTLEAISEHLGWRKLNVSWLEWNAATVSGKYISVPQRDEIPENIKEQLIVELYSK